jgi:hypothetical protein
MYICKYTIYLVVYGVQIMDIFLPQRVKIIFRWSYLKNIFAGDITYFKLIFSFHIK